MSIKLMTQIWDRSDLATGEKFVLIALADHANDDGDCYPSMEQIGRKCAMTERNARTLVHRLVDRGFVVVTDPGGGRGRRAHYRVVPYPEAEKTLPEETRKNLPGNGQNPEICDTKPGNLRHSPPHPPYIDKPSKNRHPRARESDLFKAENGSERPEGDLFSRWWKEYPRREARKKAEEKFRAAIKKVSFEVLMKATRNYAAAMKAKGTEQQFIAHAATWLNQERWEDWLQPPPDDDVPKGFKLVAGTLVRDMGQH